MRAFKLLFLIALTLLGNVNLNIVQHRKLADPITTAAAIVKVVSIAYKAICAVFGVGKSTTFEEIKTKKGFKYYDGHTLTQFLYSVKEDDLMRIKDAAGQIFGMPKFALPVLDDIFEDILVSDANAWMEYTLVFDTGKVKQGDIKYAAVFSKYNEEDDTYHLILVHMGASFTLSDKLIARTDALQVGMVYSGQKTTITTAPRSMEEEDIQQLFFFFKLISYKKIAERFGMSLQYPEIK